MTSKDYLSQEEIDALLRQSEDSDISGGGSHIDDYLTPLEQDALGEIGNITFGSAATALSTLLGKKVDITTPTVSMITRSQFNDEFPKPHVAVHVTYVDGFEGINSLVIKTRDAQVIADLMLGGEGDPKDEELNEIHVSAVQEAMNQMMGSSATSMSTIFNRFVNISPPGINILDMSSGDGVNSLPSEENLVKISFRLTIGDLIDSTIMQLLTVKFSKDMVNLLINGTEEPEQVPIEAAATLGAPSQAVNTDAPNMHQAPSNTMPPQAAYGMQPEMPYPGMPMQGGYDPNQQMQYAAPPQHFGGMPNRNINVQPIQFSNFQNNPQIQVDPNNLNLLMDIPLKVTVELGRTHKQIKDILELSQGSIVELDKLAGEPVDILVNNKLIAKGEVVVIDENFGVRVIDIVSQWDRIQKIQ
ncbi:flagellar motor switch phosphatase FliY [Paenibacillus sp. IHBB 10380]|uniref:flagellar motor switch phosphatase FliY n=1 Tax=Paenibacillus sp. IHBB 10380 TaxID=1566358 RepID=UPI0005CFD6C4|nr:flagellar motor switch phosphatase FliY [Paenibacillus sp. IHBB 10380]AJS59160.1 flagellar motor switch protein FliN [Paenibacillus sp. IHBB 10380]